MTLPISSGRAARLFQLSEPRLNDLIRRGKIASLPPVTAGRRLWWAEHLRAIGQALDLSQAKIEAALGEIEDAHDQSGFRG